MEQSAFEEWVQSKSEGEPSVYSPVTNLPSQTPPRSKETDKPSVSPKSNILAES